MLISGTILTGKERAGNIAAYQIMAEVFDRLDMSGWELVFSITISRVAKHGDKELSLLIWNYSSMISCTENSMHKAIVSLDRGVATSLSSDADDHLCCGAAEKEL